MIASMATAFSNSPAPVGHCPDCGYDQRGLPSGSVCPECGGRFRLGRVVGDINRWAELRLLDLWSIAVLQAIGLAVATGSIVIMPHARAGAVMLGMAATVYLTAGTIWYAAVALGSIRRLRRPAYKNILARRRIALTRWLVYDGVLVVLPILGLLWLGAAS